MTCHSDFKNRFFQLLLGETKHEIPDSTNEAKKKLIRALRKILQFHLISWCGNFMERHSFRIVLGHSPETMRKLCLSTKFPHQEIM